MKEKQYEEPRQYLELSYFIWQRADRGYILDEVARLASDDSNVDNKKFIRKSNETTGFYQYKPLEEEPTLFLQFASITRDVEDILSFANQYGLLGKPEAIISEQMSKGEGKNKSYPLLNGERLKYWRQELWDMKVIVQVWNWLKEHDQQLLNLVVQWNNPGCVSYTLAEEEHLISTKQEGTTILHKKKMPFSVGVIAASDYIPRLFSRFSYGDVFLPARALVQRRINEKLEKHPTRARLLMDDKNELGQYFVPDSLLGGMWFQFFKAVTGDRKFRRCTICNLWADVTEKNKNWSKHPECANRERVRRSRAKKK